MGEKHKDSLIVACDGFSPSELPISLASRQCLDASRKTFFIDMDRSISRIISECNEKNDDATADVTVEPKKTEYTATQKEEQTQEREIYSDELLKTKKRVEIFPFGMVFSNYVKYLKYTFSFKRTTGHKFRLLTEFFTAFVILFSALDGFYNFSAAFQGASIVLGLLAITTIVFAVVMAINLLREKSARIKMEKKLGKQPRHKYIRAGSWAGANILLVLGIAFVFDVDSVSLVASLIVWGLYLAYFSFCSKNCNKISIFKKFIFPKTILLILPIVVTVVSILIFG